MATGFTRADGDALDGPATFPNALTMRRSAERKAQLAIRSANADDTRAWVRHERDSGFRPWRGLAMQREGTGKPLNRIVDAKAFNSFADFSIANDAATSFPFSEAGSHGVLIIAGNLASAEAAVYWFRVGSSLISHLLSHSGDVASTTGALSGTTGAAGNLTLSVHTDNRIYIENRTGSSRTYQGVILVNRVGFLT